MNDQVKNTWREHGLKRKNIKPTKVQRKRVDIVIERKNRINKWSSYNVVIIYWIYKVVSSYKTETNILDTNNQMEQVMKESIKDLNSL